MIEPIAWLTSFFALIGLQLFLTWLVVRSDLKVLPQLAIVACMTIVATAIWYVLAARYGWSLPSRHGLQDSHPRRDSGFMFVVGWVSYAHWFATMGGRKR